MAAGRNAEEDPQFRLSCAPWVKRVDFGCQGHGHGTPSIPRQAEARGTEVHTLLLRSTAQRKRTSKTAKGVSRTLITGSVTCSEGERTRLTAPHFYDIPFHRFISHPRRQAAHQFTGPVGTSLVTTGKVCRSYDYQVRIAKATPHLVPNARIDPKQCPSLFSYCSLLQK